MGLRERERERTKATKAKTEGPSNRREGKVGRRAGNTTAPTEEGVERERSEG